MRSNTPAEGRGAPRLARAFFRRDVLEVAPALVGATLVRRLPDGEERRLVITETEAYRGEADTACHARRGRTKRTAPLYCAGGVYYIYLCYGIHWLLNVVTGPADMPQAVLIRACEGAEGPGRLTRALDITGAYNGADAAACPDLGIEAPAAPVRVLCAPRVGIGYAAPEDQARPWRFIRG